MIDPDALISAYKSGLFPMADTRDTPDVFWVDPELRGQLSIPHLHIPARLMRTVRTFPYRVTLDHDFMGIIDMCARATKGREDTWINTEIRDCFIALHKRGYAHSIECWDGNALVGGVYGLALGGLFCGESMASRARDASKIALVHLCARLYRADFSLLDTQFTNDHLKQFGCYDVPREIYHTQLAHALSQPRDITLENDPAKHDERALVIHYLSERTEQAAAHPLEVFQSPC